MILLEPGFLKENPTFPEKEVLMIQIPWRRVAGAALVMCLLLANTSYAETTQDNINDAKNQIEDLKDQKKDAEDTVNDISGKKDALESDLSGLNGQLSDIVAQINDLEGQISDKQGEIDQAKEDLAAAEAQSAKQYEDMSCGFSSCMRTEARRYGDACGGGSFSEFLNRTEYITDINAYDRKKLVEYQDLQEQIAAQKEDLESDMTELVAMQDDMKKKQANVSSLINTTKANLAQTQEDLADAQSNVADLEDKTTRWSSTRSSWRSRRRRRTLRVWRRLRSRRRRIPPPWSMCRRTVTSTCLEQSSSARRAENPTTGSLRSEAL